MILSPISDPTNSVVFFFRLLCASGAGTDRAAAVKARCESLQLTSLRASVQPYTVKALCWLEAYLPLTASPPGTMPPNATASALLPLACPVTATSLPTNMCVTSAWLWPISCRLIPVDVSSDSSLKKMYLFTALQHPHGHWQLQELLMNQIGSIVHHRNCSIEASRRNSEWVQGHATINQVFCHTGLTCPMCILRNLSFDVSQVL